MSAQNVFIGRDLEFSILLKDSDLKPINITGRTFVLNIYTAPGALAVTAPFTTFVQIADGPGGEIKIIIPLSQMNITESYNGSIELVRTDSGSDVVACWPALICKVGTAVNKPSAPLSIIASQPTQVIAQYIGSRLPSVGTIINIIDVSGLQTALDTLQTNINGKTAIGHAHVESDVTGLVADLAAKAGLATANTFTQPNLFTDVGISGMLIATAGPMVMPMGRLTLATGIPIMFSDTVGGVTTVFYTPNDGNFITVVDRAQAKFNIRAFTELSSDLSNISKNPAATVANTAYDLYVWEDVSGVLTLSRSPAWAISIGASASRGTGAGTAELTKILGMDTNKYDISSGPKAGKGTYVGTMFTSSSNTIEFVVNPAAVAGGGNPRIGFWNRYNKVPVTAMSLDSTASWAGATNLYRAMNSGVSGGLNNRVTVIKGLPGGVLNINGSVTYDVYQYAALAYSGMGVNSITVNSGIGGTTAQGGNAETRVPLPIIYAGKGLIGSNYYQMLERASAGTDFGSDNTAGFTFRSDY